jgi:hypothetical protein
MERSYVLRCVGASKRAAATKCAVCVTATCSCSDGLRRASDACKSRCNSGPHACKHQTPKPPLTRTSGLSKGLCKLPTPVTVAPLAPSPPPRPAPAPPPPPPAPSPAWPGPAASLPRPAAAPGLSAAPIRRLRRARQRCAQASRYRQPQDSFHRKTSAMARPCEAEPAACMKYLGQGIGGR